MAKSVPVRVSLALLDTDDLFALADLPRIIPVGLSKLQHDGAQGVLATFKIGRRSFVRGRDVLAYIELCRRGPAAPAAAR